MIFESSLAERTGLSKERLGEFLSISEKKSYRKGEILFQRDTICTQLGCIVSGALRTYCVNDLGEEISFLLQVDRDFFGDYESFITKKRSAFIIEAIIDTEVFLFDKERLDRLIDSDIFWTRFSRTISDICFLEAKRRIEDLLFYSPEQRYSTLLSKSPDVIRKIPLKYISTYLGITPQSLSRIRKRIIN